MYAFSYENGLLWTLPDFRVANGLHEAIAINNLKQNRPSFIELALFPKQIL